jgi:hypothetical protein
LQAAHSQRNCAILGLDRQENNMRPMKASGTALSIAWIALAAAAPVQAEVVGSSPAGFSLKIEVPISVAPDSAFRSFVRIGSWWNDQHTYSGNAVNMTLGARPGGCFCERLPHGGFVKHLDVVFSAPGKELRLAGGLGPLQGMGGSGLMDLRFKPEGTATRLILTYTVGGFATGKGYAELAAPVDGVLTEQLGRFKRFAETGNPGAPQVEKP